MTDIDATPIWAEKPDDPTTWSGGEVGVRKAKSGHLYFAATGCALPGHTINKHGAMGYSIKKSKRFREALYDVFELIGGTERFAKWADSNPGNFYKLAVKTLAAERDEDKEAPRDITVRHVLPPPNFGTTFDGDDNRGLAEKAAASPDSTFVHEHVVDGVTRTVTYEVGAVPPTNGEIQTVIDDVDVGPKKKSKDDEQMEKLREHPGGEKEPPVL